MHPIITDFIKCLALYKEEPPHGCYICSLTSVDTLHREMLINWTPRKQRISDQMGLGMPFTKSCLGD